MKKWITAAFIILLAWNLVLTSKVISLSSSHTAKEQNEEQVQKYTVTGYTSDITSMVENVRPAIVRIETQTNGETASGTGIVFENTDGTVYITTYSGLLKNAGTIQVVFDSGAQVTGTLVGTDPASGVGVVSVEPSFDVTVMTRTDSDSLTEGEYALAAEGRNPDTLTAGLYFGIISGLGFGRASGQVDRYIQMIETDLPSSCSCGEPLVNIGGALIGMIVPNVDDDRIYAIGVSELQIIADEIITNGSVELGILGVTGENIADLRSYQRSERGLRLDLTEGVLVNYVFGNSENIILENDVITKVQETNIATTADLRKLLYTLKPGEEVKVTVERNGELKEVSVVLQ